MEKKSRPSSVARPGSVAGEKTDRKTRGSGEGEGRPSKKMSEYGRQLREKQKVKDMYGLREKQFRRYFGIALQSREGVPGENLLQLLERRIDNTLYRLKLATTRTQARQVVVHGHVMVNGKKVHSPSYLVSPEDEISLAPNVINKPVFLEQVIDKRLNIGVKVPEWLEIDKAERKGRVLRMPIRSDIQAPIEEYLIVELYSK